MGKVRKKLLLMINRVINPKKNHFIAFKGDSMQKNSILSLSPIFIKKNSYLTNEKVST